ncbi:hypothetical protein CLIB1423_13S03070 [[Candida] railenensis]|uniref:YMC020W-like alpha/beta hydrolase domain-containing protein n=1 Tax=[Candida] railenensis TaxID=45579 RepID=A0A9P0QR40_9ASCO|nr:hypothetical protein CLIB1423_13S03070 [[Candida] railenensis]
MSNGSNWSFSLSSSERSKQQPQQQQSKQPQDAHQAHQAQKAKQSPQVNQQSHQQPAGSNLGAITEASRENSETSSRKASVVDGAAPLNDGGANRRKSSWWFWSEEGQVDGIQENDNAEENEDQSNVAQEQISAEDANESNGNVNDDSFFTYRRMSSVISYVYTTGKSEGATETSPLLLNEANISNNKHPETAESEETEGSAWFSWVWNPFGPASNGDGEPNLDDDLLKSAKVAIEANKDSLHYAFKNNRTQIDSAYGELAVSHTKTEVQPVRYKYKKVPLIPNQVQEQQLAAAPNIIAAATSGNPATILAPPQSNTSATGTPRNAKSLSPQLPSASAFEKIDSIKLNNGTRSSSKQTSPVPLSAPQSEQLQTQVYAQNNGQKQAISQANGHSQFNGHGHHHHGHASISGSSASSIRSSRSLLSTYRNHLVAPTVDENFRTLTVKTKVRLVGEHILFKDETSEVHLYKSTPKNIALKKTSKIKKIVVIGVHGFFPFKMVKALIGESTGNSMRFTNEATKAIYKWLDIEEEHDTDEVDIATISLEGKGKISERVDNLYKLLLNWEDLITSCDFLFIIGHSQGSAVAIHLLSKLISESIVRPKLQKVGLLSMSGILQGPFTGLDNKIIIRAYTQTENEILNELFEFQKPGSSQRLSLNESLETLIENNVKITLSGSIDDQLIPMYSSLSITLKHPNIFRCINVSENCDYPNFIIVLIKIILMLMNMGRGDHGLLIELSKICMGTTSKGGHSKIYLNNEIYFNAIKHTIETTSLNHWKPLQYTGGTSGPNGFNSISESVNSVGGSAIPNVYLLPWCIRELLEELGQTKHIRGVSLARELVYEYKNWEPTTKNWKEIKFCLEALEEFDIEEIYS